MCRFPRCVLELCLEQWPPGLDLAAFGPRLCALDVVCKSFAAVNSQIDVLRPLVGKCCDLKELKICSTELRNVVPRKLLSDLLANIPPGLRVLHLQHRDLFDTACAKLGELPALQELHLSDCKIISGTTFDAMAMLPSLSKLCLAGTSFADADAARIFPQMHALRDLRVNYCHAISAKLLHVLPPSLTILNASGTAIFEGDAGGDSGHETLRELHVSGPGRFMIKDLAALAYGFGKIRVLNFGHSRTLKDTCVRDAFKGMPLLEVLMLSGCPAIEVSHV